MTSEVIESGAPLSGEGLWLTNYGLRHQSPSTRRFFPKHLPELELFVVTEQIMNRRSICRCRAAVRFLL